MSDAAATPREAFIRELRSAPSLDDNGYICTKDVAIRAFDRSCGGVAQPPKDDLRIVLVPRELYYHEITYVRGLEEAMVEAHAIMVMELAKDMGLWHGNERVMMLLDKIETLLKKVDK